MSNSGDYNYDEKTYEDPDYEIIEIDKKGEKTNGKKSYNK